MSDVQSRHGDGGWSAVPYVVMVDERGYWWRVFGEGENLSMVPTTSDNDGLRLADGTLAVWPDGGVS